MKSSCIIFGTLVIVNVFCNDNMTSSEIEMDHVIDMLIKNEMPDQESVEINIERELSVDVPVYSKGVWRCGECDHINESKLIYEETYDLGANYVEEYIELQVGFAVQNMRCMTVSFFAADELSTVSRLSGSCLGGSVTLRLPSAAQYEVRAYE